MNVLDAELALDRLEARLASELPAHIAASARAYAANTAGPSAIEITHRDVAAVLAAGSIDSLRARSMRVLRVIAPIVIESAPRVIAARALARTWENWRVLTEARDAHAHLRFGVSMRVLTRLLSGIRRETSAKSNAGASTTSARSNAESSTPDTRALLAISDTRALLALPDPIAGWSNHDRMFDARTIDDDDIRELWSALVGADAIGADAIGTLSIDRSATAHPRTFVVERGARANIVVPTRIDTPSARFAVLHELGHALLWLAPIARGHEWPRAIDEAAASYVARAMEGEGALPAGWYSPLARAARERRLAIARVLDAIESNASLDAIENNASLDAIESNASLGAIVSGAEAIIDALGISTPPWALWNDPHAQASYVEAERIAGDMPTGLRGVAVAAQLADLAYGIDAAGHVL